jgi:hypothetical protein
MTQVSESEVATSGERLCRGVPGLEWLREETEKRVAFVCRRSIRSYRIKCLEFLHFDHAAALAVRA